MSDKHANQLIALFRHSSQFFGNGIAPASTPRRTTGNLCCSPFQHPTTKPIALVPSCRVRYITARNCPLFGAITPCFRWLFKPKQPPNHAMLSANRSRFLSPGRSRRPHTPQAKNEPYPHVFQGFQQHQFQATSETEVSGFLLPGRTWGNASLGRPGGIAGFGLPPLAGPGGRWPGSGSRLPVSTAGCSWPPVSRWPGSGEPAAGCR